MPPDPGRPTARTNEPVMDEFGLPRKPPSKALAYLIMTAVIVCDVVCLAMVAYDEVHHIPAQLLGIGAGVEVIMLAGGSAFFHKLKLDRALGPTGRRITNVAFGLALLGADLLLQSIDPNASSA